ncbi:nitrile hydratase accessory protein [Nocardioides aromaticivorans]|uniref:Nitrile hydratase accessory protein n=1 Tax=Nocardioides aromaticivorans TaxID=200618 RepID=A0ABX7PGP8_9ACTN|nr:nitrile hydratase accessory protein [Nocardioides aromaticivorans]QSR24972.1 nitrile hydratase accessory protein [Nocardioides aromaticivorans]
MLPAPYADPAELVAARSSVAELVCDLPEADPEQLSFEHPWEIRAFAMAVSAHRALGFDWTDFQQALITSISGWEESTGTSDRGWSYYEHWLAALESVLAGLGLLSTDDLARATGEVLAVPANRNHHEAHTEPIAIDPARLAHP